MDYNQTNTYRKTVLIEKISSKNVKLVFIKSCSFHTYWYNNYIGCFFYIENPSIPFKLFINKDNYIISKKNAGKFKRTRYVLQKDCQIIQ